MNFIFIIINRIITNIMLCLINSFRKKTNCLWHNLILTEIMIIKWSGNNNKNNNNKLIQIQIKL